MEFRMIRPTDKDILAESTRTFHFNKKEIEEYVKRHIRKYEGRHYDEHEIKEAKVDRATLNKFKEAIEEKRKAIKKRCLEPYERFEKEVKEVLGYIEKPIEAIDEQIKGYEEGKKEEKKKQIEEHYNEVSSAELTKILPLSKIFNAKWLNSTYKIGDIKNEISEGIEKFMKGLEVISGLKTEYEGQIKDKYIKTLDLTAALAEKERLEEQKKKFEELEECRRRDNLSPETMVQAAINLQNRPKIDIESFRTYEVCFRVRANLKQLNELKTFLIGNGIEYEKI
jgi:soluble cytochrome b562